MSSDQNSFLPNISKGSIFTLRHRVGYFRISVKNTSILGSILKDVLVKNVNFFAVLFITPNHINFPRVTEGKERGKEGDEYRVMEGREREGELNTTVMFASTMVYLHCISLICCRVVDSLTIYIVQPDL